MFIAGPPLVKAVVFEDATVEDLGSPKVHCQISGVADLRFEDDKVCMDRTKELLSYLPSSCNEKPPIVEPTDDPDRESEELRTIIPTDPNRSYDMHDVLERVVDNGKLFEIKAEYAKNVICTLARMNGQPVGIIASNPAVMAGCLDYKASQKAARFIRFCDCYGIPLLNFQDVPAFLIGTRSERNGIIRHGSKMLYAYSEATVPKITLVLRKAYAGGYLAMCSKDFGADFVFELPTAEICLMGPPGAVNILFRKEMKQAKEEGRDPEEVREKRLKEFYENYVNPLYSAGLQHVDDIIDPKVIRPTLIRALAVCLNKRDSLPSKKHGNMPI